MTSPGNRAIQLLRDVIVTELSLGNLVIDFYYSRGKLSDLAHDDILSFDGPEERNEAFLQEVLRTGEVDAFLQALEFENTHGGLALKIKQKITDLKESDGYGERNPGVIPFVKRTDTRCGKMKKMIRLNFRLREITSHGRHGHHQFRQIITSMRTKHQDDHDVLFHMYDAESAFLRVFYQQSEDQEDILDNMELLADETTHPIASKMVYLARRGSFIAMKGRLKMGLQYLKRAKTLSDQLHPCKDTGMVQYVEINLLLQKYQQDPDPSTKEEIIRNINHAIQYDFAEEEYEVKEDYTKMMYLKLAFCYLGINCFCELVPECPVEENDCVYAEECLKRIDSLPGQLYNRHLMFYIFAESVLSFRRGNYSKALILAKQAAEIASESEYVKELTTITRFVDSIDYGCVQEESVSFT